MPSLNWIGKEKIVNHDKDVPFRLMRKNKKYSLGESENLILEGDNLEALKALMPFYYGKIKCIYIDPPYNTGNEKWVYNDKVNSPKIKEWLGKVVGPEGEDLTRHDKWLCMMYPRLKLLRELLSGDGAIFVSIDNKEQHSLRQIMNDIFDEENFVAILPRRTKSAGKTTDAIASNNDYIFIYAKDIKQVKFSSLSIDDSAYKFKDKFLKERGPYALSQTLDYDSLSYSPSLDYELVLNGKKFYPGSNKKTFLSRKAGNHRASDWTWRWSKKLVNFGNKNGFLVVKEGKNGLPRIYTKTYYKVTIKKVGDTYKIVPIDRAKKLSTLDLMESEYSNDVAKKDLRSIFGASAEFAYPKPISLVKYLVNTISETDDTMILDSFAGSGTTAHAVLDLNKEDGGNRKFILVELEKNIAKNITAERAKRVARGYSYKTGKGKAVKVPGLGGGFEYVELGAPLFKADGNINDKVSFEEMASYVYFTETLTNIDKRKIKENFIGEYNGTGYYLLFKKKGENILNRAALKGIKKDAERKVVYADKCLLGEEVLKKYNIIFKQIPYQVKIY